jgi:hypothetical protein
MFDKNNSLPGGDMNSQTNIVLGENTEVRKGQILQFCGAEISGGKFTVKKDGKLIFSRESN